MYERVGVIQVS